MYIIYQNGIFKISDDTKNSVVKIDSPNYIENREKKTLKLVNRSEYVIQSNIGKEEIYEYTDSTNHVTFTIEQKSSTLFYLKRSWKNTSDTPRKLQTIMSVQPCFEVQKYLIPNVSINGNAFGNGKEPKGLEKDGKKWIFSYDRVALPSMTLTENDDFAVALFASAESTVSLMSSCSISKNKTTGVYIP